MQRVKVVIVGDYEVGKSRFLVQWCSNDFPGSAVYTVDVDGKPVEVALWDTPGHEDYARLRPLQYPDTDVFLVAFCVKDPSSLTNIKEKWLPEIHHYCPNKPMLLLGLKYDLRGQEVNGGYTEVRHEDALQLAKDIGEEFTGILYIFYMY